MLKVEFNELGIRENEVTFGMSLYIIQCYINRLCVIIVIWSVLFSNLAVTNAV